MKIKYAVVCCVLLSLRSFLLNAIPKVKIEVRNGVPKIARAGSTISKKDLGGNEDAFKALVDFTKLVSKLRNAKDDEEIDGPLYDSEGNYSNDPHLLILTGILDEGKKLLDKIYPDGHKTVFLYPYEIGKTFNLRISNILIALADTKKTGYTVWEKSYISAALFAYMMQRIFKILKKENKLARQFNKQTPCQNGGNENIYCGLKAKDYRENISAAAIRSGNFLFMYILDSLLQGDEQRFNRDIEFALDDPKKLRDMFWHLDKSYSADVETMEQLKEFINKLLQPDRLKDPGLFNAAVEKFGKLQGFK